MKYLLLLMLAGCATKAPTTQEVMIPVYVPCVKNEPAKPALATAGLAPDASDGEKVLAVLRDMVTLRKYTGELEAVIEGCR